MKKEYKMSAERKEELQNELTYLKTVREQEVAELIKEARGFGDLSENSEYDEAKNEQGKLYSRIAEIEDILLHAVIVDESNAGTNAVGIGCRVTVADVKPGRELPEYKVVGSQEAAPMHRAHGCEGGRRGQRGSACRHHRLPHCQDRTLIKRFTYRS